MGVDADPDVEETIGKIRGGAEALRARLAETEQTLVEQMRAVLAELYPPLLAEKWDVTPLPPTGTSAALLDVSTTAKEVYGYEFGTPPHPIYPKNAGGVLAWPVPNATVFTRYVAMHPGTPAHNRRNEVYQALRDITRAVWGAALDETMTEL